MIAAQLNQPQAFLCQDVLHAIPVLLVIFYHEINRFKGAALDQELPNDAFSAVRQIQTEDHNSRS
jgi:hypothetical protein